MVTVRDEVWDILACPYCGAELADTNSGATCSACGEYFRRTDHAQLDLRLKRKKQVQAPFELGSYVDLESVCSDVLEMNPQPECDFSKFVLDKYMTYGNRPTPELCSYFPRAARAGSKMLDLGCGLGGFEQLIERTGFQNVGLDYDSPVATVLGDAHALPFKDESFEFIMSIAVLEHVHYPFLVTREVYRVLQPSGIFIGTVAFLETFHMDSLYHHTGLGTLNSLAYGGFHVRHIAPNTRWTVLPAVAAMSLFPGLHVTLSKLMVAPLNAMHKLWWRVGNAIRPTPNSSECERLMRTTGGFAFIAAKQEARKGARKAEQTNGREPKSSL
jgi:SAM-dependent methyltransferase